MSEWYKLYPLDWDRGTDNLTLEQEAAFLRVCNSIYASDQPIAENYRVLAGFWRCNERKARRLLSELIAAGKLTVDDGLIYNERAMNGVSILRQLRVERQSAGRAGGIESGKARSKSLDCNDTGQAIGSTREEKRREENKDPPNPPNGGRRKRPNGFDVGPKLAQELLDEMKAKKEGGL